MKKKLIVILAAVISLLGIYFFGSGFAKQGGVFISEYSVSPDGSEMTIQVGVASSIGYIRKVSAHQKEDGKLYLDCYSAFGGINGSIGAKSTYTIPLNEDTKTIGLYRYNNTYEDILEKDRNGEWQRIR